MTIEQAVNEILQRADEAFATESVERARRFLYLALTETLREGNFSDTDAHWFVRRIIYEMPAATNTVEIGQLESALEDGHDKILAIRAIYKDIDTALDTEGFMNTIEQATREDIRKWGIEELRPNYTMKWYQVGRTLYFYPKAQIAERHIGIEVVRHPRTWSSIPGEQYWTNTTQLADNMTRAFLNRIIEAAAQLLRQEVAAYDG